MPLTTGYCSYAKNQSSVYDIHHLARKFDLEAYSTFYVCSISDAAEFRYKIVPIALRLALTSSFSKAGEQYVWRPVLATFSYITVGYMLLKSILLFVVSNGPVSHGIM